MDADLKDYCNEAADYIVTRATAGSDIQAFYEQYFSDKMGFREFILKIVTLHVELEDYNLTGKEPLYYDDEYAYISEKTGVSSMEIIELVVWLYDCFMMSNGCVTFIENCPGCGHNELYEREVEGGGVHEICYECVDCGRMYSFDEILGDPTNELPLRQYKEPDPLDGLNPDGLPVFTDKDAIYRFRVSRSIIELFGYETLADLSREIQEKFGLSDFHMSSFYMGKKFFERNREIRCPAFFFSEEYGPSDAENYEICRLNLYENQKFLYLNNFIQENRFNIRFLGIKLKPQKLQ